MRVVVQRVSSASVEIEQQMVAAVGQGLLVLVGFEDADAASDVDWVCGKVAKLRIFDDATGVMNLGIVDVDGDILVVSQFTLHASTRKGNRPSYIRAARPEKAIPLYEYFIEQLESVAGKKPFTGVFGADMKVSLINDGPVTIIIDTVLKE